MNMCLQFLHKLCLNKQLFMIIHLPGCYKLYTRQDMFCCGETPKQYHIEIFRQPIRSCLLLPKRTPAQDRISPRNGPSSPRNLSFSQRKQSIIGDSSLNPSVIKKESRKDKEIRVISEEWLAEVAPIDVTTITQPEMAKYLLEAPRLPENGTEYCRMIKKSNYDQLIKDYASRKYPWVDKDFLKSDSYNIFGQDYKVSWVGLDIISKRVGSRVKIIEKFIEPKDIVQSDIIGDCYFMSAIAALAQSPRRVLRLFPNLYIGADVFMTKMMFKGIVQEVVVDQYFPCQADSQQLLGCRPCKNQSEIYAMILQKCWAKLWKSYAKIDGGFPHEALRALTGAPTKNYILPNVAAEQMQSKNFFKQILEYDRKGYVMCTGTNKNGSVKIKHRERGWISVQIQAKHIYTVEYLREYQEKRMIKIYNPWGHNLILGTDTRINGEFIIQWQEFVREFFYLTVCKISDQANYLYMELQGCKRNKMRFIELEVSSLAPTTYALALSETDNRKENLREENRYICATIIVLREYEGQRYEFLAIKSCNQFCDHYLQISNVSSGKLLVGLYFSEVDIQESLTFSIYSEGRFGFRQKQVDPYFQSHFFSQVLLNYNTLHPLPYKYPNHLNPKVKVTFKMGVQDTNLGFYLIQVDKDSPQSFTARMCKNQFLQKGLEVLPPYDRQFIQVSADPGHTTVMVIKAIKLDQFRNLDTQYYLNTNRHICEDMIFEEIFKNKK